MGAEVLSRIHKGHLDMDKSEARARLQVYWPTLNTQIESIVKQCEICQVYRNCQQKETLNPQVDSVRGSCEQIAADTFHLKCNEYLLVVDFF